MPVLAPKVAPPRGSSPQPHSVLGQWIQHIRLVGFASWVMLQWDFGMVGDALIFLWLFGSSGFFKQFHLHRVFNFGLILCAVGYLSALFDSFFGWTWMLYFTMLHFLVTWLGSHGWSFVG